MKKTGLELSDKDKSCIFERNVKSILWFGKKITHFYYKILTSTVTSRT